MYECWESVPQEIRCRIVREFTWGRNYYGRPQGIVPPDIAAQWIERYGEPDTFDVNGFTCCPWGAYNLLTGEEPNWPNDTTQGGIMDGSVDPEEIERFMADFDSGVIALPDGLAEALGCEEGSK